MNLYLFNPDTDLALADGHENYLSPASARRMAADLAVLPLWYAEDGAGVLAPSAYNADFVERMADSFPLGATLVTEPEVAGLVGARPCPWGWNPSVRRYLRKAGLPEESLPAAEDLQRWRGWASREQVAGILEKFQGIPHCVGESVNLRDVADCRAYAESCREGAVLKAPWSGSGKGLRWCRGAWTEETERWCARLLRRQGCVVASPWYAKVEDFAMEFVADGRGGMSFAGYSLFRTNERGAYVGNWLLSDDGIERHLEQNLPCGLLPQVRESMRRELATRFPTYAGCLGVDMMVCRWANGYAVHPCVEVNLRMSMGMVAARLRRFLPEGDGCRAWFSVEHCPTPEALLARHAEDEAAFPPWRDGHSVSACCYWPLTPVTPASRYRAFVKVVPDTALLRSHTGPWR